METNQRIAAFKQDLGCLSSKQIIRKHLMSAPAYVLTEEQEFQLKDETAEHFGVEYSEIIIVGSGKLSFSVAPTKRYAPFGDNSDIDIAIISERLFTKVWKEIYLYRKSGAYWPERKQFFEYLSLGWIRPDKLPKSSNFKFAGEWWQYFYSQTTSGNFGPYKIRAGLYHSWFFFFEYQRKCIEQCKSEL